MNNQNTKYTFHISGMHCKSCVLMTESELGDLPNVSVVKTNLKNNTVQISGNFGDKTTEQIINELNEPLKGHGYVISQEKQIITKSWSDFRTAIPLTIIFILIYIILQKVGLVNFIGGGKVTYGSAFAIGIIASLSTCMAVVGGLLLSMSATFAKGGDKAKPQILFHIGRLSSFLILGGVIGIIGKTFEFSSTSYFVLNLIIGLVMLVLGINLLDVFHFAKKIQPTMPKFIAKRAFSVSKMNHSITPFIVGVITFFLPCGFTQSMQLYTLSTGSFSVGALIMFSFALGTLPVLGLLSFSSFSIKDSSKAGIFFKASGLIVILFAIFNIINSLVVAGIINPIFNF